MHFKGKTPHGFRCKVQVWATHCGRLTDPWWISWDQAASFPDLYERPSTERRQTFPSDLEASNAAEVHWSLASLRKLSLRVCMRTKCMSDVLHRSWICSLDVRSMWLSYGFEGSFAMIEAQIFLFLHRKQHGFMIFCLLLHQLFSASADVRLIDRLTGWFQAGNWAPPLSNSWQSFCRRVGLTKLYWSCRVKV